MRWKLVRMLAQTPDLGTEAIFFCPLRTVPNLAADAIDDDDDDDDDDDADADDRCAVTGAFVRPSLARVPPLPLPGLLAFAGPVRATPQHVYTYVVT